MSFRAAPTAERLRALPKVVLHDHLDGGVRPATLIDRAAAVGHPLPTGDPAELAAWFEREASAGSLEAFLALFVHPVAVMQDAEGLARVAREAVLDHAADGVVHAELRWAPGQHLAGGLGPTAACDAVRAGIAEGVAEAAAAGRTISATQILTARRDHGETGEVAALALAARDRGVVGFDIAGPEAGFTLDEHLATLRSLREAAFPVTLHAGEAAGPEAVGDAVLRGLALRVGHGVRVVEDVVFGEPTEDDPWGVAGATLGRVAGWVRDRQIPLEVSLTSNLQTGVAPTAAAHPITALARLGFAVTVNTDNRLMSRTTLSREMARLVEVGWTLGDLANATLTAAHAAFLPHDERHALVDDVIIPAYREDPA